MRRPSMIKPKLPPRWWLFPSLLLLLAALPLLVLKPERLYSWATGAADPVTAAWTNARAAGSYHFESEVTQVTMPTAKVTNVGHSSRTERFQLNGTNDLRANTLEMQILANDGSALAKQSGTWLKVVDGNTYVRQGDGDWQLSSEFSDGVAPEGDFTGYLRAVRDLTLLGDETRAGIHFARYQYAIDSPAYAAYVRDQMEATLRAKGELPVGVRLEIPRYYLEMVGSGELWIRDDGLPLRQILTLQFPEQQDTYLTAQVAVTFSRFGQSNATYAQLARAGDWRGLGRALATDLPNPTPLLTLLGMSFFAALIVQYRRRRAIQTVIATTVIASMVAMPVVNALQMSGFYDVQVARAATEREQQARLDSAKAVREALGAVEFDPHQNPLTVTTDEEALATGSNWANTLSSASAASVAAPAAVGLAAAVQPPSGITNWWPGDGNATDISGGQAGTLNGSAGFAAGQVGQAFNFNGSNGYVALPAAAFGFPTSGTSTTPFSFEFWFKTAGTGVILGQQSQAPYTTLTSGYVPAIYIGTDGKLRVELFWRNATNPITSAGAVNNNLFHHVAVIYNGTTQTVYLDGATMGSTPHTQTAFSTSYQYQLGTGYTTNWPGGLAGWANFTGLIDEPTLYNRALTQAEAQAIYNAGSDGKVKPTAGSDSDSDGLTDGQEASIGTRPLMADSDLDGLNDNLEVRGFTYANQQWYLNPNAGDSNGDGLGDALEWGLAANGTRLPTPQDTDGDGVPDLFDRDNDNDGVPDGLDLAPAVKGATYAASDALRLSLQNLAANQPTFVEFQLRPETPEQLWYSFNVLDWPQDEDGQIRDVDNVTFADYATQQGRTAGMQERNGDLKLIPMLEIRMAAANANLPPATTRTVTDATGQPATRTVYPDLEPMGITVRDLEQSGANKVVYVPLNLVTDEQTGARVAFSGQMRYLPSGSWSTPHEVRLVWTVQALNDQPIAVCDSTATPPLVDNCTEDGYLHNVPQVIQSYTTGWNLTGMMVQEERGTTMNIAYGDPTTGTAPARDDAVNALTTVLNSAFVVGRDFDNNGRRDLTAATIVQRFDRTKTPRPSEQQRYAIPDLLRIDTATYLTFENALATTAITKTVGILNSMNGIAAGDANFKPLLLFAYERASRSLSLDLMRADNAYINQNGNNLVLNMSPAGQTVQPVSVMAGIRQVAYCPTAGSPIRWEPCALDTYWNELDRRYDSVLLPGESDVNLTVGRVLAAQLSYAGFNSGYVAVVEEEGRIVSGTYSLATDEAIEANVRYGLQIVGAGAPLMAEFAFENLVSASDNIANLLADINVGFDLFSGSVDDFTSNLARNLAKITRIKAEAAIGAVGAVVIVLSQFLTFIPGLPVEASGTLYAISTLASIGLTVVKPIVSLAKEISSGATTLSKALNTVNSLSKVAKVAGVVGLVITVGVSWGIFFYTLATSGYSVGSPELNKAFAETVASTIVTVYLAILALNPIGAIIAAIVGVIDFILTVTCELGVSELRLQGSYYGGACFTLTTSAIKTISYFLYNYDLMVDASSPGLFVTGAPQVTLTNPNLGYVAGNPINIALPVTTTVKHKDPDPENGLYILPYLYLFSPDNLRSSTIRHNLSSPAPLPIPVVRDQMKDEWSTPVVDHNYLATPMYRAQAGATLAANRITFPAGINRAPNLLYVNSNFALPAYECVAVPNPIIPFVPPVIPICYTRTFESNSSNQFDNFRLDILPDTLDGFMARTSRQAGTLSLRWDPQFQPLNDADGDGLLSSARGGLDPNDATWDNDQDGLADTYELQWREEGVAYSPLSCDTDLDGLTDKQEAEIGSNPAVADTDNDGLKDGEEVWHQIYNSSTCQPTASWSGGWEISINGATPFTLRVSSAPVSADGDNDGISDLAEKQLAGKVDSNNISYNPNVANVPPLAVYTDLSDSDRIVAPGQSLRYTTTVVATEPMLPGVLDVTAVTGGQTYPLFFNPNTFNGSQNVTVATAIQAPTGNTQRYALTSSARTRLSVAAGPAWLFDPVVTEPTLPIGTSAQQARQVALAPARSDRQDSYRLTAVSGASTFIAGTASIVGDVLQYNLPGAQTLNALDEDGNNRLSGREEFPAQIATNNRGVSLALWRDWVFAGTLAQTPYKPNSNGFVTDLGDAADTLKQLDINGDGKDDILWYRPGGGFAGVYLSNGDGSLTYKAYRDGPTGTNTNGFVSDMANAADKLVPMDINGDGKDDILYYRPGGSWGGIYLSNGDGSLTYKPYKSGATATNQNGFSSALNSPVDTLVPMDINGDGKDDILYYQPGGGYAGIHLSTGDGSLAYKPYRNGAGSTNQNGFASALNSTADRLVPMDINGDGKDDILWYQPGGGYAGIHLSNGDGALTYKPYKNGPTSTNQNGFSSALNSTVDTLLPLDINGDGKEDIFYYQQGGSYAGIQLSNGDGSLQYLPYANPTDGFQNGFSALLDLPEIRFVVLDQNHDGRDDLLYYRRDNGRVSTPLAGIHLSNGDGTLRYIDYMRTSGANISRANGFVDAAVSAADRALPLDLNGDGWDDFLWYRSGENLAGAYLAGRQQIGAALIDAAGNVQKRFVLPRNPALPPFGEVRTFQPLVASDGENFFVAYEAGMNSGPDRKDYLALQSFDATGAATGSSAFPVNATDQSYTGPSRFQSALIWIGDRYRVAMQVRGSSTIAVRDFSPTAAPLFDAYVDVATDARPTNPALALAGRPGGWLLAYATTVGVNASEFPGQNTYTARTTKPLATGDPLQVVAAYHRSSFGWLVGWYNSSKQLQLAPLAAGDSGLQAITPVQSGFSVDQFSSTALACPVISAAPVTDIRFEELPDATRTSFLDSATFFINATCSGNSCPQAGVTGATYPNGTAVGDPASDYAVRFDGVNDFLTINRALRDNFSVAFWIKAPAFTQQDTLIFDQGANQSGGFTIWLSNGRPGILLNTTESVVSATRIDDNKWHSVVATRDRKAGTLALYVDGSSVGTRTAGTAGLTVVNDIRIGSDRTNARRFTGELDNLQLYETALAPDTVKAFYDRTNQNYCVAAAPTANGSAVQWAKLKVYQPDYRGGSVTASGSLNYIVDSDRPTSTVTSVQNNQYVKVQPNAQQTVIIGGYAGDRTAGVARVDVNVNNGGWQPAEGLETWTWPLVVGPEGVYNVRSRATDGVGNVESVGNGINVIVDGTPPTGVLTVSGNPYPVNSPPLLSRAYLEGSGQLYVPIFGAASDPAIGGQAGSGVQRIEVRLVGVGDGVIGNGWQPLTAPPAGNQWTMNYRFGVGNPDPTGTYSATLRLTDNVGNQVPELFVGRLNVDGRGPSAIVTQTTATPGELTTDITTPVNVAGTLSETGVAGIDSAEIAFVALDQMATYTDTVLFLPMDNRPGEPNWTDLSAKQNAVTCTQCPEVLPGRIGQAVSQFGALTVADAPHLNFDQNQSFSVQGWVKLTPNNLGNFSSATPVTKQQGTTGYYLSVFTTGATWQYTWFAGGSFLSSPTMAGDSQWHHLVAVVDRAAGTMSLYADGALVKSAAFTGTAGNNLPITLAQSNGTSAYDQIAIFNHVLTPAEVLTLYRSADVNWQSATLTQRGNGVAGTTWSHPAPTSEGMYQIDLRSRDMLGNEVLSSNIWRGLIDTVDPRVTLTGRATGQSYLDAATGTRRYELVYTCRAEDFLLDETTFDCAGNVQQPPTRGFNSDPVLQDRFPDLQLLNTLVNSYTVWADSATPAGSLVACDAYGHCTTVTATAAATVAELVEATVAAAAVADAPNAVIVEPTDGSAIAGDGELAVTVAVEADGALKSVQLLLDGTEVGSASFEQSANLRNLLRTFAVPMPSAGVHELTVRATDWSGAQSTTSEPVEITVYVGTPTVTVDSATLEPDPAYIAGSNIYRIHGTVSDPTLDSVKVKVGDRLYVSVPVENGAWAVAYPVLDTGGDLTITVVAANGAGQSAKATETASVARATNAAIETTLFEVPPTPSADDVTFQFKGVGFGDVELLNFECSLDGSGFSACPASYTVVDLSQGEHTMRVRAVDGTGAVDATPAEYIWTVGGRGILVTITKAPAAETSERGARFIFTTSGGTLECALDGGAYSSCSSPKEYTGLADGPHTFLVRTREGNETGTPSSHSWRITNGAPVAQNSTLTVDQNGSGAVTLVATDEDSLRYQILQRPQHGVLLGLPPQLAYTPDSGYSGSDSFTFRANDGEFDSNVGTVAITVEGSGSTIDFGNCNGDSAVDAGDLTALVLEIFDGDGSSQAGVAGGSFAGTPGCDANNDATIDAGDLSCTVLIIFEGTGACVVPSGVVASEATATLAVAGQQSVAAGATVTVPVLLQSSGRTLTAAAFALTFDPKRFTLNPTDATGDGIPDAVAFTPGVGQVASAVYKAETGRIEIALFGSAPESAPLADGVLAAVTLTANPGQSGEHLVTLTDGSLGDGDGSAAGVTLQDGTVIIAEPTDTEIMLENRLYLPLINR